MDWANWACVGQTGAVLVILVPYTFPLAVVPARLWGGRSHCVGRLELLFAGTWGSVCAEGWDLAAARVLCRQLGCGRPRLVPAPCGPTAASASPAVLRQVQCTGQEWALEHCTLQPGHPSSCPTDRVAAVECEGERATQWGDAAPGGGSLGAGVTPVSPQTPSSCGWWVAPGAALGGWR